MFGWKEKLPPLDFIVVGAQKCATSWLYYCLQNHPEVHLPAEKNDEVYLGGTLHEKHGHEWFRAYLGEPSQVQLVGDISVNYLFDPRAAKAVRNGSVSKIIASLRDPIDRLRSAYYWKLRRGIVRDPNLSRGVEKVLRSVEEDPAFEDPLNGNAKKDLVTRGEYDEQVNRYTEFVERENILLIPFSKIKEDAAAVLRTVYEFIGVDASFSALPTQSKPQAEAKQLSPVAPSP